MKRLALLLSSLSILGYVEASSSVQKVLGLLNEMKIKGAAAMESEEKQHADYNAFCKKTLSQKAKSIEETSDRIEVLKADVEKFSTSVATLTSELKTHKAEIEKAEMDSEKTKSLREQEVSDYNSTRKEYEESIGLMEDI